MRIILLFKNGQFAVKEDWMASCVFNALGLFDVDVECHDRFYGSDRELMQKTFNYLQLISPAGAILISTLCAKSGNTGTDGNGDYYIERLIFDAEVTEINTSTFK